MKAKDASIILADLHPEMQAALVILDETRRDALQYLRADDATITAGKEPGHSLHSLHHDGLAIDVRIADFAQRWAFLLERQLGNGFDVVIEPGNKCGNCGHGIAAPHIHIERDPKKFPLVPTSDSGGATGLTRDETPQPQR